MIRIGAALFNGDHTRLGDEMALLESAGVDFLHLDVFDGHFLPDMGFPLRTIEALRPLSKRPFEVHAGVLQPQRLAKPLAEAGVDAVLFHPEASPMVYEALFAFKEENMEVGVALGLGTPLEILPPILPFIDKILLLARVAGEGSRGASYHAQVEPRLARVRQMLKEAGSGAELQIAGGVNRGNIQAAAKAGARGFALGSGLYKVPDMGEEVRELRRLLSEVVE